MSTNENPQKSGESKSKRSKTSGFEEWGGYMVAKKMKLEAQFEGQKTSLDTVEAKTEIFKGISIYVNGYTNPNADELKRLMCNHGGKYHHYYSYSKTTHIIASNLPNSKIKNLKKEKVVTADWITDSIKAVKLLPHQNYLLYSPETLNNQPRLNFHKTENTFTSNEFSVATVNATSPSPESSDFESRSSCTEDLLCEENLNPEKQFVIEDNNCSTDYSLSSTSEKNESNSVISLQNSAVAVKAGHPAFLSEFYNHSRLHHISTTGQELRQYVQELVRKNKEKHFPGRDKLKLSSNSTSSNKNCPLKDKSKKVIMHLDMDCFFVSVGLRKHPELKGQPVAVTHSKGLHGGPQKGSDAQYEANHYANISQQKIGGVVNIQPSTSDVSTVSKYSKEYGSLSEIASCSYEARKAGVRNGMFLGEALRRCPTLKTIDYDFEGYSEVSKQLYDIVARYTLDIQAVSCDELFIDCTQLLQDVNLSPYEFATQLRSEIEGKTNCTASAGMSCNMLLARLANKEAKPNGQYFVSDSSIEDFMKKQSVKNLPGVGYTTSKKLEGLGVKTCSDLQSWSLSRLQQELGPKTGLTLHNHCFGKDNRSVQLQKNRKSVSAEINYGIRFEKEEEIYNFINELSLEVQSRLQNINCRGKAIALKVMARKSGAPVESAKFMGHGVCDHLCKSIALKSSTDNARKIASECCSLSRSMNIKPQDYRGLGIQISKLEPALEKMNAREPTISMKKNKMLDDNLTGVFSPKNTEEMNKDSTNNRATIEHFFSYNELTETNPIDIKSNISDMLNSEMQVVEKETSTSSGNHNNSVSSTSSLNLKDNLQNESVDDNNQKQKKLLFQEPKKNASAKKNSSGVKKYIKGQATLFDVNFNNKANPKRCSKASLAGAVDLEEIKSLLQEWVQTTAVPLDVDTKELKTYILDSIDEDLGHVTLVLAYFYEIVCKSPPVWKELYLSLLSYAQQKALQKYDSMLNVTSEFPS